MIQRIVRGAAVRSAFAATGLLVAAAAQAGGSCPPKTEVVNVTVAGDKITSPAADSSVTINLDETKGNTKVCWEISGLDKADTLTFSDKGESTASIGFDRGKSVKGTEGADVTRVGTPDKKGEWRYAIALTRANAAVDTVDPEVQVCDKNGCTSQ